MSAPKPKVTPVAVPLFGAAYGGPHFDRHTFWTWRCSCGEVPIYGCDIARFPSQAAACDDATRHSRTHDAERVADGLERSGDEMVRKSREAHDEIDRQRYAGKASAYYESAFSVLRHLVN